MRGTERTWLRWFSGVNNHGGGLAEQFRVLFQPDPGPDWKLENYDFDRDHKRMGMTESLWEPSNPDLRKFNAAGENSWSYSGWNDPAEGVLRTVDYYETVEEAAGPLSDAGVLSSVHGARDGTLWRRRGRRCHRFLSYLETWVEKNRAPQKLIGSHVVRGRPSEARRQRKFPLAPEGGSRTFSRPIYPYPAVARYLEAAIRKKPVELRTGGAIKTRSARSTFHPISSPNRANTTMLLPSNVLRPCAPTLAG